MRIPFPALVLLTAVTVSGCSDPEKPPRPGEAIEAPVARPELTVVTAETAELMFRYASEEGFAQATAINDIPEGARARVQVVDLSRSPAQRGADRWAEVFDLTAPGPDGRFKGRLIPRTELESTLARAEAEAEAAKVPTITMYSASWCGVCRKARAFMDAEGIAYVEKDIEKDPGAQAELRKKAQAAGIQANGVPVFDIGGKLMSGFDPDALKQASGRKG